MPTMTAYAAGTFCWPELGTTDTKSATAFYTKLLDWTAVEMPLPGGSTYTMLKKGDKDVSALYPLMEDQVKNGVPPHWLSYVAADDVDAVVAKVKANGGTVLVDPMDVNPDGKTLIGRMAAIQDPTGAAFALWQAGTHAGATLVNEPGSLCWNELMTRDLDTAKKFYTAVLDWSCEDVDMPSGKYTLVKNNGNLNGGMMTMPEQAGDAPPHWLVYFAVDDCDARADKATSLGAKILMPSMSVPTVGRIAVLQDPQGAVFAIIKLEQPAS